MSDNEEVKWLDIESYQDIIKTVVYLKKDFLDRLHNDGFKNNRDFFKTIVTGYVNDDSDIRKFIEREKNFSKSTKKLIIEDKEIEEQSESLLLLSENEIENIFDKLEELTNE